MNFSPKALWRNGYNGYAIYPIIAVCFLHNKYVKPELARHDLDMSRGL